MTPDGASDVGSNPFEDRSAQSEVSSAAPPTDLDSSFPAAVLVVDRNATLTLGTDSLIVLDAGLKHKRNVRNACGLLPSSAKTTRAIPFYSVLWAELVNGFDVSIKYAQMTGKRSCRVGVIQYTVLDKTQHEHCTRWVEALMSRAYPVNVKRRKKIKGLINPFGGQGYAPKLWTREVEPIFAAANIDLDAEKTTYRGHAIEIARELDIDTVDVVVCASGDGTPHEVFNGLAKHREPRRALRNVAVTQIPGGSGNAMSLNLNGTDAPSLAALAIVKGVRTPIDLMAVTQGDSLTFSFLSQSLGIIAESDLGTERLRWMGSFRFTWGILVRLFSQTVYPAEVSVVTATSDKSQIRDSYLRALQEHASTASGAIPSASPGEPARKLSTIDESPLPPLKYGTINDPLAADFSPLKDMPDLGNFYVGNMAWMSPDAVFFTTALPTDGKMDMIDISAYTSRTTAVRMLATIEEGTLINFPEVNYSKIHAYRIIPRVRPVKRTRWLARLEAWIAGGSLTQQLEEGGLIAVDGEKIPFAPFQVEVVPGLGTVLSKRGAVYEFDSSKVFPGATPAA